MFKITERDAGAFHERLDLFESHRLFVVVFIFDQVMHLAAQLLADRVVLFELLFGWEVRPKSQGFSSASEWRLLQEDVRCDRTASFGLFVWFWQKRRIERPVL